LEKQQIPASQMYEADLAVSQAKLQREAAEAQLQVMKLGPRAEAVAEAESHITTAEALVDSAQAQLNSYALKSPIDGVLDSLNCQLGQTMSPGTAVGEIVDIRKLMVIVWLPSHSATRVTVGQTAHVSISTMATAPKPAADADDDEAPPEDTSLAGAVTFVGHVVDPQTGNLPVQIVIDNAEGQLAVGQVVSVDITVNEKTDVLAAPAAALFDVGDGMVIDIIRDGKSVRVQPDLGIRDKHWAEIAGVDIKDAPKAGELAIVEGGYNLPDGTVVKVEDKSAADAKSADEVKPADESKPAEKNAAADSKPAASASKGGAP
jgi:multidrug efflux pump subunit AcrA (membrane-fusion protein)